MRPAEIAAAQAKVKEMQLNLSYATIRSPVTGVASRALQRQGAYINSVSESAKLTYVAALDPMFTRAAGVDPDGLTWPTFIARNLVPVTLGNVIGGTLLVGIVYWFVYLRRPGAARAEAQIE